MLANQNTFRGVDAEVILRSVYETTHGVRNHFRASADAPAIHPFSLISFNECEENLYGTRLAELVRRYKSSGVKEVWGIDLMTFLELPEYMCELLVAIGNEKEKKD
jgi:hypothetical protein